MSLLQSRIFGYFIVCNIFQQKHLAIQLGSRMDLVMTSTTTTSVILTEMTVVVLMSRSNIVMTAIVSVSIHLLSKHILTFHS